MSNVAYKAVLLKALSSALAPAGFRRRAGNFQRTADGVVHLVQLQSSTSSTADTLKVAVNLGVWVPSLEEPEATPAIPSAHWRERLSNALGSGQDHWWIVSSTDEAHLCALDLERMIRLLALPAFESLNSVPKLLEIWKSGKSPGLTDFQRLRCISILEQKTGRAAAG